MAYQHGQINLKPRHRLIYESNMHGYVTVDGHQTAIGDLRLSPNQLRWKKSGLLETSLEVDNDDKRKEKIHINTELNLESKHWRHMLKA